MSSEYDHGESCDLCGLGAGRHRPDPSIAVVSLHPATYEAGCSCGRIFGPEASGQETIWEIQQHILEVEACPCSCHERTHWPDSMGGD